MVFLMLYIRAMSDIFIIQKQADILVVSCTSDKFINKGIYRPHVPEKLRALNLAAYDD